MNHPHHPARPGTAIALSAQALPSAAHSRYAWLGMALLLAAIVGVSFQVPVMGVLLAAACSFALLRTAAKAKKQR